VEGEGGGEGGHDEEVGGPGPREVWTPVSQLSPATEEALGDFYPSGPGYTVGTPLAGGTGAPPGAPLSQQASPGRFAAWGAGASTCLQAARSSKQ